MNDKITLKDIGQHFAFSFPFILYGYNIIIPYFVIYGSIYGIFSSLLSTITTILVFIMAQIINSGNPFRKYMINPYKDNVPFWGRILIFAYEIGFIISLVIALEVAFKQIAGI
jgi:hypothetical protein